MKLASYRIGDRETYGLVDGEGVIDAGARLSFPDLKSALAQEGVMEIAKLDGSGPDHDLADIQFLPVIPNPGMILCVGLNYATHIREMGRDMPQYPALFPRYPGSQVGHGQPLIRPKVSDRFDFEGELALVIGRGGRYIPKERALEHVAGYACYNDGSIRDWQWHTHQFLPGKNFMKSGSFGPWLVTKDEIPDPSKLTLETRLNGSEMQKTGLDDLVFSAPDLIEYISTFTELKPGDVILTGTPGGVGAARKPPVFMKPGDRVEVEISGIGILANPIVAEGSQEQP